MIQVVGPVAVGVGSDTLHGGESSILWNVESLPCGDAPPRRSPPAQPWFNTEAVSGVETDTWLAWISNDSRTATIWAAAEDLQREAFSIVVPGALRREGILDCHGAVIAPDPGRPDAGVFVTGLSGSGKSTLTASAALGGARFATDDSVAIGPSDGSLRAWSRRSALALSPAIHGRLFPSHVGMEWNGKILLDGGGVFGSQCSDSLKVCAVVFLESVNEQPTAQGPRATKSAVGSVSLADAYRRLIMSNPILSVDTGARSCFSVVRRLAEMPAYTMAGGSELLDPETACATLTSLLPKG